MKEKKLFSDIDIIILGIISVLIKLIQIQSS